MQRKCTPIPTLNTSDLERFWGKVDREGGSDSCWEWKGKKRSGYGRLWIGGKIFSAHRIALLIEGRLDDRLFACHTCDNPSCCNPAHLYCGTTKQNTRDMIARGRDKCMSNSEGKARGERHGMNTNHGENRRYGERNPSAKITDKDVRIIRSLLDDGWTQQSIADHIGVSRTPIRRIKEGKNWTHIE